MRWLAGADCPARRGHSFRERHILQPVTPYQVHGRAETIGLVPVRVPDEAQSCTTLIQVALSLADAVPRSSDPGGVAGFSRNAAGMLALQGSPGSAGPSSFSQATPLLEQQPLGLQPVLRKWTGRDGVGLLLKVPASATSPLIGQHLSVALLAGFPLQLGPQATGHGAIEVGDPQWREGAHLH